MIHPSPGFDKPTGYPEALEGCPSGETEDERRYEKVIT